MKDNFRMKKATLARTCLSLLFLALLCSTDCKPAFQASVKYLADAEKKAYPSSELPRSITADISGDYTEHFSANHEYVSIGAGGSIKEDTAVFVIVANKDPTQTTDLTPGILVKFPGFAIGMRQDTVAAFVRHTRGESTTNYGDQPYNLYYQTPAGTPLPSHITFTKADKLPSPSPLVVRYHLVGTFEFPAVYAPEQLSLACTQDAQAHSGRNPMYRADLCGAKKIVVKGNFDITQDFRSDFFE
jgi:hypothetical protein